MTENTSWKSVTERSKYIVKECTGTTRKSSWHSNRIHVRTIPRFSASVYATDERVRIMDVVRLDVRNVSIIRRPVLRSSNVFGLTSKEWPLFVSNFYKTFLCMWCTWSNWNARQTGRTVLHMKETTKQVCTYCFSLVSLYFVKCYI